MREISPFVLRIAASFSARRYYVPLQTGWLRHRPYPHSTGFCARRLLQNRAYFGYVVAYCDRGAPSLAHCVADLVQSKYNVASGIDTSHRRSLVRVDYDGSSFAATHSGHLGKHVMYV
jgi:hypothetical protein